MSAAPDPPERPARPREAPWKEFARAPLVPVALAATAGLIADRYFTVPPGGCVLVGIGGLVGWFVAGVRKSPSAVVWLWLTAAALAAGYHHAWRRWFAPDDIGTFARAQPAPVLLRGTLDEEPAKSHPPKPDPLLTQQKPLTTVAVLAVTAVHTPDGWKPASGKARLT